MQRNEPQSVNERIDGGRYDTVINSLIERGKDEGYQLSVWVSSCDETNLMTFTESEAYYQFAPETDAVQRLDDLVELMYNRYGLGESPEPIRLPGDSFEVHIESTEVSHTDFAASSQRRFELILDAETEEARMMDEIIDSL